MHPRRVGLRNPAATFHDRGDVTSISSLERERRRKAAPAGLSLLLWGLGLGPLAHAVLAHGEPLLRETSDQGWVHHAGDERGQRPGDRRELPSHHHAPGALEHLQLAISEVAVTLSVPAVVLAVAMEELAAWRGPVLSRRRVPEVPGAP